MQDAFGKIVDHRPLYRIAGDIARDWTNASIHALPYINAMRELSSIDDDYYHDTAQDVVLRFLCNAGSWRGETAKRIKAELKTILKSRGYKI